jgi:ABC-type sugar transport system permease subunit
MLRQRLWKLQHRYAPYMFVAPFVILFLCFMIYPLGRSVILSLYKTAGPKNLRFVGLENYAFLLKDRLFYIALANTFYFTITMILVQIPLALGLAIMLNSKRVRGRSVFRFAFFSPHLVGQVFVAIIFTLLMAQRHGLVNRTIGTFLPFIGSEIDWLGRPALVMPTIVLAALWLSVGYGMVYFLAALQGVDVELYEAAEVDGASKWRRFWHVTLPGIWPVLMFMILVGTIGSLQLFELPYVLFQGSGPNYSALTIVIYLFQTGFETGDIGYASAVGWALVVVIAIVALVQFAVVTFVGERK